MEKTSGSDNAGVTSSDFFISKQGEHAMSFQNYKVECPIHEVRKAKGLPPDEDSASFIQLEQSIQLVKEQSIQLVKEQSIQLVKDDSTSILKNRKESSFVQLGMKMKMKMKSKSRLNEQIQNHQDDVPDEKEAKQNKDSSEKKDEKGEDEDDKKESEEEEKAT